ncbi:InlB B-repeat-containing protein [Bifidobacterium sp. LC6]|uniref:Alpha-amylase n=2 Tax=Bifidobacterium colobi TaxID=2809026 RepID=A0ABS5UUH8_9BIFI|nr:InlB B-repeat-containing protein [Bifidobacterium colobi]
MIKRIGRAAVVALTSCAMVAVAMVSVPTMANAASSKLDFQPQSDVTIVAFQQTWNTVAAECTKTYGPEGIGWVQVSPPAESVTGTQWWTAYQPVSTRLDSRYGTEAEFKNMIATCNAAHVGIIADAVINHTTGTDVALVTDQHGVAGTPYNGTYGRYPFYGADGVYRYKDNGNGHQYGSTTEDFHDCDQPISDYTNADEVRNCRPSTMWDLNTGSARVQNSIAEYLASLWRDGVRGYRIDSSKHMAPEDIAAIKAKLAEKIGVSAENIPWVQEVIYHQGEAAALAPSNYLGNGDVTEFSYAYQLKQDFSGSIADLKNISSGLLPSDKANVFVSNWDTERGTETLTPKSGARYELANAFLLAYDYGTPKLLSSYWFSDSDAGAAGTTDTEVPDVDFDTACTASDGSSSERWSDGQWICQQRWTSTRGMVRFHNAVAGTKVTNWSTDGENNIGFEREGKGFLAMNNTLEDHKVSYTTSLKDGVYCNVYASRTCTSTVEVKDGKLSATVPARSAVAIIAGVTPDNPGNTGSEDTDPSDPKYEDTVDVGTIADTSLTVYYKPEGSGTGSVTLNYGLGTGVNAGQSITMKPVNGADGWYSATIKKTGLKGVSFHFTKADGSIDWSGGENGKNYTAKVGSTMIMVEGHKATLGTPVTKGATESTRVIVHVKSNVAGAEGITIGGKYYKFNGTADSYGSVADLKLDGHHESVDFAIVGADHTTPIYGVTYHASELEHVDGVIEAWVDAANPSEASLASPDKSSTSSTPIPNDQKNPVNLTVTIHYQRGDGDYQAVDLDKNIWNGWDIYSWTENAGGTSDAFTGHDDFGEIATYTFTSNSGVRVPWFLIRQGGDTWKDKDPDDNNRLIPESLIRVDPNQQDTGTAEFWVVSGDSTLYASKPTTYRVTFDANGGETTKTIAVTAGKSQRDGVVVPDAPTRKGYAFKGWYKDAEGTEQYQFGTPVTSSFTLYAKWTPAVTIRYAGHENEWKYPYGDTVLDAGSTWPADWGVPGAPERDGYTFLGWYLDEDGTEPVDWTTHVWNKDATVYAKWKSNAHTVTFDSQGGSAVDAIEVKPGEAAAAPADPVRKGFIFNGWTLDANGTQPYSFTAAVNSDLTLYAQWVADTAVTHTVTYHTNDGTDATTVAKVADGGLAGQAAAPQRDGYVFTGWALDAAGKQPYDVSTPVKDDLDLYAVWAKLVTVTFDYADGTGRTTSSKLAAGQSVTKPEDPIREGYDFAGWATEQGKAFDFGTPVSADLKLIAQWTAKKFTVSFDTAGGSAVDAQQVEYGKTASRPKRPVRDGYVFQGWSLDANDTTAANIYDFDTPVSSDTTLHAIWGTMPETVNPRLAVTMHATDEVSYQLHVRRGKALARPADPIRYGYIFQGWTTDKQGAKPYDFATKVERSGLELWAQWKRDESVNLCDGSGARKPGQPAAAATKQCPAAQGNNAGSTSGGAVTDDWKDAAGQSHQQGGTNGTVAVVNGGSGSTGNQESRFERLSPLAKTGVGISALVAACAVAVAVGFALLSTSRGRHSR